jgi:hypothetical protein
MTTQSYSLIIIYFAGEGKEAETHYDIGSFTVFIGTTFVDIRKT